MYLRMDNITLIGAAIGLVGLIIAFVLYGRVKKVEIDDKRVAEITDEIQAGAMAFLFAEYKVLAIFVAAAGIVVENETHPVRVSEVARALATGGSTHPCVGRALWTFEPVHVAEHAGSALKV